MIGFDYSFSHPNPAALRDAGATFACRYLSNDPTKNLTVGEVVALGAVGIAVVCNWESTANRAEDGFAAGVVDAQSAISEANAVGMPADRPIYFSVDENTTVGPNVTAYFQGVASVLGQWRTGGYGGYRVIKGLFDANLIAWGWQTYAWSAGFWDLRAHIRQVENGVWLGGVQVDRNEAMTTDFGQWSIGSTEDELTPDDWTKLTGIVRQAVTDGVKYEIAALVGTRTTPKDSPVTALTTLANILDGIYIAYHGIKDDATHPGLTDIVSAVKETNSRVANLQVPAVDPAAVKSALSGLKIEGTISE